MTSQSTSAPFALLTLLCACGSLGGDGGGAANLPNRGIVPYERVDNRGVSEGSGDRADPGPEHALVLPDGERARYLAPSAVVTSDGVRLFVEVADDSGSWIGSTTSDDVLHWPQPEPILFGDDFAGTGADAHAPAVVVVDDGTWRVAVEVGDGEGIGIAAVGPDGVSRTAYPVVVPTEGGAVGEPSLLRTADGGWWLYYTDIVVDTEGDSRATVARATSVDGWTFEPAGTVLDAGVSCVDSSGEPDACWDRSGVGDVEVREATTALGRLIYRMWYVSGGEIGFASSYDGATWERFPYNPVLDDRQDESGPSNVWDGSRYLLFFSWRSPARGAGIALAINDEPAPSERL